MFDTVLPVVTDWCFLSFFFFCFGVVPEPLVEVLFFSGVRRLVLSCCTGGLAIASIAFLGRGVRGTSG